MVLLYEAIYYLQNPEHFVREAFRVLRDGGILLVCTANKNWADFNPSPFSTKYFSVPELAGLLKQNFHQVDFYGGFSVEGNGIKDALVSFIKRTAVSLHMMPKSMKGKELFKRLFFGKLYPLPMEITEGMAEYIKPTPISSDTPNSSYKVIFAVGQKGSDKASPSSEIF